MLLHLPIVILTTLSPITISDGVPRFDIAKECQFEGGASEALNRCLRDETEALQQLRESWSQFALADRNVCTTSAMTGGYASYIELLSCLDMSRDAASETRDPNGSRGATVGVARDRQ